MAVTYTNSPLVDYTEYSPFCSTRGNRKISKITIHHTAGVISAESLGRIFSTPGRNGSSNYGIGYDGKIGLYVKEQFRAWTSGSYENDSIAVTIEVSNSKKGEPWPVSDLVYNRLIYLCADICRRNGIKKLKFTGDKNGNLTAHRYFQATSCPGTYLYSRFAEIADDVNALLEDPMINEKIASLEKKVAELESKLDGYSKETDKRTAALEEQVSPTYKDAKSIPKWATYTNKMIKDGIIGGDGKDLGLSYQMIRENEFCGRLIDSKTTK